jgi:hypothetical protein
MSYQTRNAAVEPDIDQRIDNGLSAGAVPMLRLWAATLYGGLKDYAKALDSKFDNDHPWITWVTCEDEGVQSFAWMCDIMEFNPAVVRGLATENYKDLLHGSVGKKKRSQV